MTDEQRKLLVERLRKVCFTELCEGVDAMMIKERAIIKEIGSTLGLWDSLTQDLAAAKNLSWRDKVECRAAVLAESESSAQGLFYSAWLTIYALYRVGELKQTEAILIICRTPEDYRRGKLVADLAVREFLNRR